MSPSMTRSGFGWSPDARAVSLFSSGGPSRRGVVLGSGFRALVMDRMLGRCLVSFHALGDPGEGCQVRTKLQGNGSQRGAHETPPGSESRLELGATELFPRCARRASLLLRAGGRSRRSGHAGAPLAFLVGQFAARVDLVLEAPEEGRAGRLGDRPAVVPGVGDVGADAPEERRALGIQKTSPPASDVPPLGPNGRIRAVRSSAGAIRLVRF